MSGVFYGLVLNKYEKLFSELKSEAFESFKNQVYKQFESRSIREWVEYCIENPSNKISAQLQLAYEKYPDKDKINNALKKIIVYRIMLFFHPHGVPDKEEKQEYLNLAKKFMNGISIDATVQEMRNKYQQAYIKRGNYIMSNFQGSDEYSILKREINDINKDKQHINMGIAALSDLQFEMQHCIQTAQYTKQDYKTLKSITQDFHAFESYFIDSKKTKANPVQPKEEIEDYLQAEQHGAISKIDHLISHLKEYDNIDWKNKFWSQLPNSSQVKDQLPNNKLKNNIKVLGSVKNFAQTDDHPKLTKILNKIWTQLVDHEKAFQVLKLSIDDLEEHTTNQIYDLNNQTAKEYGNFKQNALNKGIPTFILNNPSHLK